MTDQVRKYRKKPVEIEAVHYAPVTSEDIEAIANWCGATRLDKKHLVIETMEGRMIVDPGDYIIKGVNGEFYPCKEEIFEKTYEPVEDSNE
jgi:hypothetical protein